MSPLHRSLSVLGAAWLVLAAVTADALAGENINLRLESVEVRQQRERDGDRPYFVMLQFRSRIATAGSTEVRMLDFEPHDWVSKPEYRAGLGAGEHMRTGQRAAIPWWMGELQWRDVNVVDIASGGLAAAAQTELLGAVILSLDNNNTPPHVIREVLERARRIVHDVLVDQVERSRALVPLLNGNTAQLQAAIAARATQTARRIVSGFDVARLLFQLTVGSTFNPDQVTGVHVLLMPTATGLATTDVSQQLSGLPAGPVTARFYSVPPGDRRETWTFAGSGARYQVVARIDRDNNTGLTRAERLQVRVRTGEDDLRRGSRVTAEVQLRNGRLVSLPLMAGAVPNRDARHGGMITLPAGTRLDDIATFRIRFHADGGGFTTGPDKWKMDAIQVLYGGERLLMAAGAGRELKLFTQRQSTWEVSFEPRGAPHLAIPPIRFKPSHADALTGGR